MIGVAQILIVNVSAYFTLIHLVLFLINLAKLFKPTKQCYT